MYFKIRRVIDTIMAFFMLIILLPLFLLIAISIKIDSEGEIIFKQQRMGKAGKSFTIYKFRTMVKNAQNIGTGVYSFSDDPRITKVGRILRKTSLDELPQLYNIIKGDMAFVGPRAPVVGHFPKYDTLDEVYKRRFSILPGITGLAQCIGRNEFSWDEKVKYDNIYINKIIKYGILFDIKIWFLTFIRIFSMNNIEESKENLEKNKYLFNKKISEGDQNEI